MEEKFSKRYRNEEEYFEDFKNNLKNDYIPLKLICNHPGLVVFYTSIDSANALEKELYHYLIDEDMRKKQFCC